MDPLSITAGVAGVATMGASLASALYDIIASIRDAPREMVEIAQGMHELSVVLRELRRVIKKAHKLLRDRLFKAVASAMSRIRDTQDRVDRLLDAESGLSRVIWAFRKSKTTKLLATIESHKSTVQLMATTMTLAMVQRERSNGKSERSDIKRTLRTEAETLVRATERSLQELSPRQPCQRDQGVQTDNPIQQVHLEPKPVLESAHINDHDTTFTPPQIHDNQLEKWGDSPEDTAKWLYRLVFQTNELAGLDQRISVDNIIVPDLLIPANRTAKAPVVDRLLSQWTKLSDDEIQETFNTASSGGASPYAKDLERRVRQLEGRRSMSELPFLPARDDRGPIESSRTEVPQRAKRRSDHGVTTAQLGEGYGTSSASYGDKAEPRHKETGYYGSGLPPRPPVFAPPVSNEDKLAFAADYMDMARRKVSKRSAKFKATVEDFQPDLDTRHERSSSSTVNKRQGRHEAKVTPPRRPGATEDEDWARERDELLDAMRKEDPASPDDMKKRQFWSPGELR